MGILDNRLALVTGAGRGLGAAMARGLADAGAKIIVADIDEEAARQTSSEIKTAGHWSEHVMMDVTDRPALKQLAANIFEGHGSISILINNAGVAGNARIGDDELEDTWDANIAVNLTGAFNTVQAFLPALSQTKGTIINICSVVAFTSAFANIGYVASKGGIRSLTQAMCRELAPHSIRVNAIAPGYIDTDMGGKGDGSTDEWLNWHCPMKRFGEPQEVVGPVVFLASPAASFINGVTLPVDGGYLVI